MDEKKILTYSDYINDRAIIEAMRLPRIPPKNQTKKTWPLWHDPDDPENAEALAPWSERWSPGRTWPSDGRNWSHDEVLFIRTHQAFEVWFAVVLHEVHWVLENARKKCELVGQRIAKVDLEKRPEKEIHFVPKKDYPKLNKVAESFGQEVRSEIATLIPVPGCVYSKGPLSFPAENLRQWASSLRRAAKALEVSIPFFDVLRTITPHQFLQFRDRLIPASGFDSVQFREIEMALGLREANLERLRPRKGAAEAAEGEDLPKGMLRPVEGQTQTHHLARRFQETSLRDLVYGLLSGDVFDWDNEGERIQAFDHFAARNVELALEHLPPHRQDSEHPASEALQSLGEVLSHREAIVAALLAKENTLDPEKAMLREFLDACLGLDRALLHWRDHHIRFVEGMIGRRPGTGGGGVSYLRKTVAPKLGAFLTHAFPCLWHARSVVQKD